MAIDIKQIDQTIKGFYRHRKPVSRDLEDVIFYALDGGGKRIRPLLFLTLLEAFQLPLTDDYYAVAAALEMIHTGSLLHDDLPAMDDDDYRRGRLTSHKQFDEARAILAGDALFIDAFLLITQTSLSSDVKLALLSQLSLAAGSFGMVGGQTLDMMNEQREVTYEQLQTIHRHKTGSLLAYPALAAQVIIESQIDVTFDLSTLGHQLGLAFQIRDDILDVSADFETIGKTPAKDLKSQKATYPSILGLKEAKNQLKTSFEQIDGELNQLEKISFFQAEAIRQLVARLRLDE